MTLGDRIRILRTKKDWTKIELSIHAGVHESSLKRAENNGGNLRLYTVVKLAKAFDLTLDQLLIGVDLRPRSDAIRVSSSQLAQILRHYEEDMLTFKEIGLNFGVSKHTARALYHKALRERSRNG